ncbi:MAG: ComGF family competence protein [Lactobacillus sp.]|jgi:competence protein ComGF|nr:ComGF family competence protein [Lactobacillus sp.]MCH3989825.1 ComGF family competence protein [Lactobacillus sp.]MCH4068009.1 ComGF family competence protein [Lactobacillus sp.]MCI1304035.1 ComGF family competence protein [Lactobacillus sp.]MCI1329939.1 ComGF family competence protein [Lactobacillus sp.]
MKCIKKRSAFSLVEVVISLAVTVLCVLMISDLFGCFKLLQAEPEKNLSQDSEIFYGYAQLDRFLHKGEWCRIETKRSDSYRILFTIKDPGKNGKKKTYTLSRYQQMLRLTNQFGQGHMPLIMNVRNAKFSCTETTMLVSVKEKNGKWTDLYFEVPPAPAEEKKEDAKKSEKTEKKEKQVEKDKGERAAQQRTGPDHVPSSR